MVSRGTPRKSGLNEYLCNTQAIKNPPRDGFLLDLQFNSDFTIKTTRLYGIFRDDFTRENDIIITVHWRERMP